MPRLWTIPNAEIFSAGEYDGENYTPEDLELAKRNFDLLSAGDDGFKLNPPLLLVPVGIGHEDDQAYLRQLLKRTDLPAAGWPDNVRVDGGRMFADLRDVPDEVAQEIFQKKLRKFSVEFYRDFVQPGLDPEELVPARLAADQYPYTDQRGRKHYGLALRRVSLLGANVPRNKFIADIPEPVLQNGERYRAQDFVTFFSEAIPMDRNQLIEALKAAGVDPGLIPESMDEGQLSAVLAIVMASKNGVAPAAATEPNGAPSTTPIVMPNSESQVVPSGEASNPPAVAAPGNPGSAPRPTGTDPILDSVMKNSERQAQQIAQLSNQVKTLTGILTPLAQGFTTQANQQKRQRVTAFCEQMVQEGRLLPFELAPVGADGKRLPGIVEELMGLSENVTTFAESGAQFSPLQARMDRIKATPPRLKTSELVTQADGVVTTLTGSTAVGPLQNPMVAGRTLDPARRQAILASTPMGRDILHNEQKRQRQAALPAGK